MFAKRLFSVKQPKAYYQSEPYLNYLDAAEKTFLSQKYVGTHISLTSRVGGYDSDVPLERRANQGNIVRSQGYQ